MRMRSASIPPPVPTSRKSSVPRSELSEVFGAITPKKLQELADSGLLAAPPVPAEMRPTAAPPAAAPAPYLTPPPFAPRSPSEPLDFRPSSIAPFAVDTIDPLLEQIPARRPSMIVESTAELARAAGVPSRTTWQTVAGIAGAIALSTLALGLVGYSVTHRMKTRTATVVVDQPDAVRTPSLEEKRAAAIPPPPQLSDNGTPAPTTDVTAPKPQETQVTLTPEPLAASDKASAFGADQKTPDSAPGPIAPTFVPAPPPKKPATPITASPVARPAAKPVVSQPKPSSAPVSAAKPAQGTGILRVPTSAVLVDGAPKKVINGAVTVSCGKHTVKAPMRGTKTIDVPCGGTASF